MRRYSLCVLFAALPLVGVGAASPSDPTMAEMQWQRRVVMICTASADDPQLLAQQRALSQWQGGDDRDVSVVTIARDSVSGSREAAPALRSRYGLPAKTFSVALIGKDGHVALRSQTVLTGVQLEHAIDAMPMRKAGQR